MPHRSLVLLALGCAFLGAGAAARALAGLAALARAARASAGGERAVSAVALAALVVAAGSAGASAPLWYRYFEADEHEALASVADALRENESLIVLVGSWQASTTLCGLAPEGCARVRLDSQFFFRDEGHAPLPRGALVVFDRFVAWEVNARGASPDFLGSPEWPLVDSSHGAIAIFRATA